jgi:WD40 repeat protein
MLYTQQHTFPGRYLDPLLTLEKGHSEAVADVAWHPYQGDVCGSVGDDRVLCLWDTRAPNKPAQHAVAAEWALTSLAFNHINTHLVATGSGCKVCLYVCMSVCLSVCMYVCMYVCMKLQSGL